MVSHQIPPRSAQRSTGNFHLLPSSQMFCHSSLYSSIAAARHLWPVDFRAKQWYLSVSLKILQKVWCFHQSGNFGMTSKQSLCHCSMRLNPHCLIVMVYWLHIKGGHFDLKIILSIIFLHYFCPFLYFHHSGKSHEPWILPCFLLICRLYLLILMCLT